MPDPTRTLTNIDPDATASADGGSTVDRSAVARIAALADTGSDLGPAAQSSAPPADPPGFALGELIGRGGMGVVYRATDLELNREVAVKLLQDKYAPGSTAARRFVDEARITAQLQHPGIPPVYRVGELPDGRPFLAMKLIQGHTLAELLTARGPGSTPWLGVFEGICQAVGYAHAHGVIHRDLKPANVMVGAFGEVQVMDWGLAKLLLPSPLGGRGAGGEGEQLTEPADPDQTAVAPAATPDRTRAGSVMGTPAYMAPEQASGDLARIDRRADVFGLGAVLCSLLTGRPPYVSDTALSTAQLAARGDLRECFARLDGCGAEPGLLALCKRCLSVEPDDRPADGSELATAIAALRAAADERARRAEVERGKAEVESHEQSKRRRVVQWAGGVTAAVLLAGVAGTTAGMVRAEEKRVEADQARGREKDRADGEERAKLAEREAKLSAVAARDALWEGLDVMTADASRDSLGTQKAVSDEQKKFLAGVLPLYQKLAAEAGDDEKTRARTADAAFRVGRIEGQLGRLAEQAAAFRASREAYTRLAADFPDTPEHRRQLAWAHNSLGAALSELEKPDAAALEEDRALAIREQLVADFPDAARYRHDLAITHYNRGLTRNDSGRPDEAAEEYRKALALLERLAADAPTNESWQDRLAMTHVKLGNLLRDKKELLAAREQYDQALAILTRLVADAPAEAEYRDSLGWTYHNRGAVFEELKEPEKAEEEYRQALAVRQRLMADFPAVPEYRRALNTSHNDLGLLLSDLGRRDEAEREYRQALAVNERLVADFPQVPRYRVALAGGYCNFGILTHENGRPADSLEWFRKAIDLLRPIHEKNPQAATAKEYLRNSHWSRAEAYDRLGRYAEAVRDWDLAIELSPEAERPGKRLARAKSKLRAGAVADAVAESEDLRQMLRWDGEDWYAFAGVYSAASAAIADKKTEYADAAVELLQKAVKAGYKDAAHMKTDADLAPLRVRDDFKKLLAELEAKFPPKPEMLPAPRRG